MPAFIIALLFSFLSFASHAGGEFKLVNINPDSNLLSDLGVHWVESEKTGNLVRLSLIKNSNLGVITNLNWVKTHEDTSESKVPLKGYSMKGSHNINYEFDMTHMMLKSSRFEAVYLNSSTGVLSTVNLVNPK